MRLTVSLSVIALLLTAPLSLAADYSTPREAYRTYIQALLDRDVKTAQNSVVGSEAISKFLVMQIQYNQSEATFRKAISKAFPETAKDMTDPDEQTLKTLDKCQEKITEDSATLQTPDSVILPVTLKRIEGKWKVDLVTMFKDVSLDEVTRFRSAVREVMEVLTPDIEQGKFKTYDDLKSALQMRVQSKMAAMDDDATTKPSK